MTTTPDQRCIGLSGHDLVVSGDRADAAGVRMRVGLIRLLVVVATLLGVNYLAWRYIASINWAYWPIALALLGCLAAGSLTWRNVTARTAGTA